MSHADAKYRITAKDKSKRAMRGFRANVGMASKAISGLKVQAAALAGAAGLGAITKAVTTTGVSFGREMANVRSVTGATAHELDILTKSAREWGRSTAFSASEASKAQYALASSGMRVKQITAALGPVLKFAGAAQTDLGHAAEITSGAINAFKLKAADATRVVNVFAAGIKNSPLNAQRLGDALAYAGPVAGTFKMELEDTVAVLGAFHSVNIQGSMAGTRFSSTMLAMQKAMSSNKGAIGELLQSWKPMETGLIGGLELLERAGYSGEKALSELGAKGGPGLAALLNVGTSKIRELREAVTGTSQATAAYAMQMDTTWGDFKSLMSALTDKAIGGWDVIEDTVRGALQGMTEAVNSWGETVEDRAIKSMKDLGQEIEHIQQLTAIRDLRDNQADLVKQTGSVLDAFEQLRNVTERYNTSARSTVGIMNSGIASVAQIGSDFNNLAAQESNNILISDAAARSAADFNRELDKQDEAAESLRNTFSGMGIDIVSLSSSIRELGLVKDPLNTDYISTAAGLLDEVKDAQRAINLGFLTGELDGAVWETATQRLTGYYEALGLTKKLLEDLLATRNENTDLANAGAGMGGEMQGPMPLLLPAAQLPGNDLSIAVDSAKQKTGELSDAMMSPTDRFDMMIDAMAATREEADLLGQSFELLGGFGEQVGAQLINASVAALRGNKKAYGEMGKVLLKYAADSLKAMAAQAAGKALFYTAEGLGWLSLGQGEKASQAFAAAGKYAAAAAFGGAGAIALGAASAANSPSGTFMSQSERENTTGLTGRDVSGGSDSRAVTSQQIAQRATTVHVTHVYYGPVTFGSQDEASVAAIQELLDSGELYTDDGAA